MSEISAKIRHYVNDYSVSDHYGKWGALRADQRNEIRKLCDACDTFEEAADKYYKENEALKAEIDRLTTRNFELSEKGEKVCIALKTAKVDAVKEFAERVKSAWADLPTMSDDEGEYDYIYA